MFSLLFICAIPLTAAYQNGKVLKAVCNADGTGYVSSVCPLSHWSHCTPNVDPCRPDCHDKCGKVPSYVRLAGRGNITIEPVGWVGGHPITSVSNCDIVTLPGGLYAIRRQCLVSSPGFCVYTSRPANMIQAAAMMRSAICSTKHYQAFDFLYPWKARSHWRVRLPALSGAEWGLLVFILLISPAVSASLTRLCRYVRSKCRRQQYLVIEGHRIDIPSRYRCSQATVSVTGSMAAIEILMASGVTKIFYASLPLVGSSEIKDVSYRVHGGRERSLSISHSPLLDEGDSA